MRLLVPLIALVSALAAQTVEGTVTNALTGAPLDGVHINLRGAGRTYSSATDSAGAFHIDNIAPGAYTPEYILRGFLPEKPASGNLLVRISSAGENVRIGATMIPMGKLSGRVLDTNNEGVKGAQVSLAASGSITDIPTDEHGAFAFEQVPPGPYTLDARPPRDYRAPASPDGARRAYGQTFYPGSTVRTGAARIDVRPGADLPGMDIKLAIVPVVRLRGRVLDPAGEPAPHIPVSLGDRTDYFAKDQQATSHDDGSFEFPSVVDGDWRLSAEAEIGGVKLKAFRILSVSGGDVDHIDLRLTAPFSIQGTVSILAPDGSPAPRRPTVVVFGPAIGGSVGIVQAKPGPDGRFTAEGIYPGPYNLMPVSPGAPFYLASIRYADRDAIDGRVEFLSGALPVSIVYRSDGGTVRGSVDSCGGATIILLPQDPDVRRRPEFTHGSRCDANGRYEITGIRPGEYYALALPPDDPAFRLLAFDFDQQLQNQATRVTVRPNEATAVDLKVIASR